MEYLKAFNHGEHKVRMEAMEPYELDEKLSEAMRLRDKK